ncbi:protein of unknown function [Hyphomicrobium sp. 1Nfss2.1]
MQQRPSFGSMREVSIELHLNPPSQLIPALNTSHTLPPLLSVWDATAERLSGTGDGAWLRQMPTRLGV